jgi:hypothetical protein
MSILSHLVKCCLIFADVYLVEIRRLKGLEGLKKEEATPAVLHEDHRWVGLSRRLERKEVVLLDQRLPTRLMILVWSRFHFARGLSVLLK